MSELRPWANWTAIDGMIAKLEENLAVCRKEIKNSEAACVTAQAEWKSLQGQADANRIAGATAREKVDGEKMARAQAIERQEARAREAASRLGSLNRQYFWRRLIPRMFR